MDANAAKRVALAKDVLAQLDAKTFVPTPDTYVYVCHPGETEKNYSKPTCEACALGSLVLACCGIRGNERIGGQRRYVLDCLVPTFSVQQLDAIETTFMGILSGADPTNDEEESAYDRCMRMAEELPQDPEPRLRAIMQNIIDHNGTFVPEAVDAPR